MSRISEIPTSRIANFFRFRRDPLGFLVDALPLGDVVSLRTSLSAPHTSSIPRISSRKFSFIKSSIFAKEEARTFCAER